MTEAFTALDFETANADLASICQIGAAEFADGQMVQLREWLVDPEDEFDEINVGIHGIQEGHVRGRPTWPTLHAELAVLLRDRIVVTYTHFDRTALHRVCEKYRLPPAECRWLDVARVVRRTWPELSRGGYGLSNVARMLNLDFRHHHAPEDARVAGEILLAAIEHSGLRVSDWLTKSLRPISGSTNSVSRDANPEGPLLGEVVVFTGSLSITRREAADLAAALGCEVAPSVRKDTSLLVVGDQDIRRFAGHEKSAKHRKANELIASGHALRILRESDFRAMLGQ